MSFSEPWLSFFSIIASLFPSVDTRVSIFLSIFRSMPFKIYLVSSKEAAKDVSPNICFSVDCSILIASLSLNSGSLGNSSRARPIILNSQTSVVILTWLFFFAAMFTLSRGNSLIMSLNLFAGRVIPPASWISTGITQLIPTSRSVAVSLKPSCCVSINILERIGSADLGVIIFCTVCIPLNKISFLAINFILFSFNERITYEHA